MNAKKVLACKTHEVASGQQKIVKLGHLPVGIFNVGGEYHAMLNVCPHRGAALCEGPQCGTTQDTAHYEFIYGQRDDLVRCAWHGWEFEIKTGEFLVDRRIKAKTYPVSVEGEDLYVHL
ncbi:Rieske (2Fe-2S) protein [Pseudomonas sp. MBLB4123]|uniref:Rieske (2Fe-2S) protein n=1 Tax=Pseudomonas sp. MBLB4123 TaxID=3451557 RepID=UPI003F7561C3